MLRGVLGRTIYWIGWLVYIYRFDYRFGEDDLR